jgi:hypothetical protein
VGALDPMLVPSWMVQGVSGAEMIAFVKKAVDAGGLAVIMFHGVGGGHSIDISREAHRELVGWLAANRKSVWTDTFRSVMGHVRAEQKRMATPRRGALGCTAAACPDHRAAPEGRSRRSSTGRVRAATTAARSIPRRLWSGSRRRPSGSSRSS